MTVLSRSVYVFGIADTLIAAFVGLFSFRAYPFTQLLFKAIILAFLVLIMLVLNVFWMIKKFYGLNHFASYLQYPYLIWLLFATYLNIGIVYFNGYSLS